MGKSAAAGDAVAVGAAGADGPAAAASFHDPVIAVGLEVAVDAGSD